MSNIYQAEHLFKLNKCYQDSEKRTNDVADALVSFCGCCGISSASLLVDVCDEIRQNFNSVWMSVLSFTVTGNKYPPNTTDSSSYKSLSIEFFDHIQRLREGVDVAPNLFARIKCEKTNIISLNAEEVGLCDELHDWAINWANLNGEVVWSFSYITFRIIKWCLDNTKIVKLKISENEVTFFAEYQVHKGEYENIEVTIDHASALKAFS